jgi:Ca-activated chloride channel family protein
MVLFGGFRRYSGPALLLEALVLLVFCAMPTVAQKLKDLPPPPPAPQLKPKPTPTPAPPSEREYEVVRITSNLVVVPVAVTDYKGEPVRGLKVNDFRIEEEGRQQEIAQLGDAEQIPLDIAILLDVSSSVAARFDFEQQAATRFLRRVLKASDSATVFAIDSKPVLEQTSTTAEIASAKLMTIKAATGPSPTAFYDTVAEAARYLAKNTPEQHRRVIVTISDGEDNFSDRIRDSAVAAYRATASDDDKTPAARARIRAAAEAALLEGHRKAQQDLRRELQSANAVFYSINPSGESLRFNQISMRGQNTMQQFADTTGGAAFVPNNEADLEVVFTRIASELRAQYLLQYYSNNHAAPNSFLRIRVSLPNRPELRLRAREGYYSKPK